MKYTERFCRSVDMFIALGFHNKTHREEPNTRILIPPSLQGNAIAAFSRAFLEVSIWSAHLNDLSPSQANAQSASHLIALHSGMQDSLSRLIGSEAGEEYVPGIDAFTSTGPTDTSAYRILGVTPESSSRNVLLAYQKQMEVNGNLGAQYLEALKEVNTLRGGNENELSIEIALAISQDMLSLGEILQALRKINIEARCLAQDEISGLRTYEDIPEDRIAEAFNEKRDEIVQSQGTESDMKELRDAMQIIRKAYSSQFLDMILESAFDNRPAKPTFTEDEAYSHLMVTKDTDDSTLCTAAQFYVRISASRLPYGV